MGISGIIIHQTHYEKSDWSKAFNQFTIACELDMINAISAVEIAFIMSSSKSAWLLSPLKCSQKQNGWTLCLCFWGRGCIIKQLLHSLIAWYHELWKPRVCIRLRQITQTSVLIICDTMLQSNNCLLLYNFADDNRGLNWLFFAHCVEHRKANK